MSTNFTGIFLHTRTVERSGGNGTDRQYGEKLLFTEIVETGLYTEIRFIHYGPLG